MSCSQTAKTVFWPRSTTASRAPRSYVLDAYDPEAKWVERIRGALIGLLSFLDAERGMGQLLVVGSLGAGHRALERRRRGIAQIIAFVDEGRSGDQERARSCPHSTAEGIVGGVLSILHARLLDPTPPPASHASRAGGREEGSPACPPQRRVPEHG